MKRAKAALPFAEGGQMSKELKTQIEAFLGPKTADDDKLIEEFRKNKRKLILILNSGGLRTKKENR